MQRETLTIDIYQNSDGDYNYDIYNGANDLENGDDSLDGGTCTSTLENALEMAFDQAKILLAREKKND